MNLKMLTVCKLFLFSSSFFPLPTYGIGMGMLLKALYNATQVESAHKDRCVEICRGISNIDSNDIFFYADTYPADTILRLLGMETFSSSH
jgi:hypothetical protein